MKLLQMQELPFRTAEPSYAPVPFLEKLPENNPHPVLIHSLRKPTLRTRNEYVSTISVAVSLSLPLLQEHCR